MATINFDGFGKLLKWLPFHDAIKSTTVYRYLRTDLLYTQTQEKSLHSRASLGCLVNLRRCADRF